MEIMDRSIINKVLSTIGIFIAAVLLVASAALFFTQDFIHTQVVQQLEPQKIVFPATGTPALDDLSAIDKEAVSKYAGQQVTTGAQANVFANNYIAAHIKTISGGKAYSELSTESRSDPTNTVLAKKVDTVFKGETLRGMLLNAYAFDTIATVALFAAYGTAVAGLIMLIFSLLAYSYAKNAIVAKNKK
jgi:hypothetical protein